MIEIFRQTHVAVMSNDRDTNVADPGGNPERYEAPRWYAGAPGFDIGGMV